MGSVRTVVLGAEGPRLARLEVRHRVKAAMLAPGRVKPPGPRSTAKRGYWIIQHPALLARDRGKGHMQGEGCPRCPPRCPFDRDRIPHAGERPG